MPASKSRPSRAKAISVARVCAAMDEIAPPALAAEWDNVGLLLGRRAARVRRLCLTIDLTEPVLAEALRRRAEMVVAYHPPIFKPIGRLTAEETPVLWSAARAGLAVYSPHTALDAAPGGTNDVLAGAIGMAEHRPLEPIAPPAGCKLVVFVPPADAGRVASAAFAAGAGRIGQYAECSFRTAGVGTFRGGPGSRPAVGRPGRRQQAEELRLEVLVPRDRLGPVVEAIRAAHSYQTPAIDVYPLEPLSEGTGMGRVGPLRRPVELGTFVRRVKRALGLRRVLLGGPADRRVRLAACCAGSCGDLFRRALAAGADAYVTGEMRHHDALAAAAGGMTVLCVGHSNSERLALAHLARRLGDCLDGLEVFLARADRDPFQVV